MNALRRWIVLRWWRRRFGERVCRNCVYLTEEGECSRVGAYKGRKAPLKGGCEQIFTLYDAARERLHHERWTK